MTIRSTLAGLKPKCSSGLGFRIEGLGLRVLYAKGKAEMCCCAISEVHVARLLHRDALPAIRVEQLVQ